MWMIVRMFLVNVTVTSSKKECDLKSVASGVEVDLVTVDDREVQAQATITKEMNIESLMTYKDELPNINKGEDLGLKHMDVKH